MFRVLKQTKAIRLTRGDSAILVVNLNIDGQPYQFKDGDTCILTIRKRTSSPSEELVKEMEDGKFIFMPDDTSEMDIGCYKYDIQLTDADGFVTTVVTPKDFFIEEECSW